MTAVKPALTPDRPEQSRATVENAAYMAMLTRMLNSYSTRVGLGDIEDLAGMIELRSHFDRCIAQAVDQLRTDQDYSWAQIARATGTSRQAAQQRYGKPLSQTSPADFYERTGLAP